jgi:hypothetical protein
LHPPLRATSRFAASDPGTMIAPRNSDPSAVPHPVMMLVTSQGLSARDGLAIDRIAIVASVGAITRLIATSS